MAVTEALVEWAQAVFGPYGALGLFALAFTEATFSPIPPDPLLAVLAEPASIPRAAYLAIVTTIASVAGAAVGYWIGDQFSEWAHRRFAGPKMDRVEEWYQEHGEWVVAGAALTPIPFKVFTITSGLLNLRFWPFVLASTVGRGLRYIPVAILATFYGEQVIAWVDTYEIPLLLASLALLVIFYVYTRDTSSHPGGGDEEASPEP